MNLVSQIKDITTQFNGELVAIRHHLHQHPELSFEEFETTAYIKQCCERLQLGTWQQLTETGGYVDIQGDGPGTGFIALRADIDALPIHESNDVKYKSKNEGVMHACGHDVHSTSLLGAMHVLNKLKSHWSGTIRCIFQAGEERLPGGASILIKEGILKPNVSSIYGQHVMPLIPAGKVGFRSGLYMASADEIYIKVIGKGGHGAHPHLNIDPVVIAAEIITELQTVVSRHAKPSIPTVVSIGKVIAEGSTNIIPNEVYMEGTLRTYDEEWRMQAHELIKTICREKAKMHGAECEVEVRKGYPFLKNDDDLTMKSRKWAEEFLGADNVEDLEIWPAGEDFAYYSQEIPACFYRLGVRNEAKGITSMVHTPSFDIDESALPVGAGLMAWLAMNQINEQ
ncbi:MAG: amidohydrolase [Bacteroidia bacterium]